MHTQSLASAHKAAKLFLKNVSAAATLRYPTTLQHRKQKTWLEQVTFPTEFDCECAYECDKESLQCVQVQEPVISLHKDLRIIETQRISLSYFTLYVMSVFPYSYVLQTFISLKTLENMVYIGK